MEVRIKVYTSEKTQFGEAVWPSVKFNKSMIKNDLDFEAKETKEFIFGVYDFIREANELIPSLEEIIDSILIINSCKDNIDAVIEDVRMRIEGVKFNEDERLKIDVNKSLIGSARSIEETLKILRNNLNIMSLREYEDLTEYVKSNGILNKVKNFLDENGLTYTYENEIVNKPFESVW